MERNLSSPNLSGVDRFGFHIERIEKPWGYELLWALTERYCGKLIFVRAGQSLSLQFHNVKDESWFIHEGRAELELAAPGEAITESEVVAPGVAFSKAFFSGSVTSFENDVTTVTLLLCAKAAPPARTRTAAKAIERNIIFLPPNRRPERSGP